MIMSNTAPLQKSSQWPETSDHHYELEVEVGCKGAFINTDRGRFYYENTFKDGENLMI